MFLATKNDIPRTIRISGIAEAQKTHCGVEMSRMSEVFIPKKDETKDRGRKMMVTMVKMRMALSWRSRFDSIRWRL